jgi:hypothetical protein
VLFCALDTMLTLVGQESAYWAGDLSAVNEMNPVGRVLLAWHPAAFVAGIIIWMAVFCAATLWLRQPWPVLVLVVAMAHAFGAATWLLFWDWPSPWGWVGAATLLVGADHFIWWCKHRAEVSGVK